MDIKIVSLFHVSFCGSSIGSLNAEIKGYPLSTQGMSFSNCNINPATCKSKKGNLD